MESIFPPSFDFCTLDALVGDENGVVRDFFAVEVPAVEVPAVEVPAVEVHAVEVPAVEVPAVEVPAVEVKPLFVIHQKQISAFNIS